MSNNEFVGMELSDAELASVQGGGWLSDAWNGVKKGVSKAAKWVKGAAEDVYNWAKGDGSGIVAVGAAVATVALALEQRDY